MERENELDEWVERLQLPKEAHFRDFTQVLPFYSNKQIGECLVDNTARQYWIDKKVRSSTFCNLSPCQFLIDGIVYPSTEHYFQMYKYSEKDFMLQLSEGDVAAYGQRRLIFQKKHLEIIESLKKNRKNYPKNPNGQDYEIGQKANPQLIIKDWDSKRQEVMMTALRVKFNNNARFQQELLNTENVWLVEHTKNDAVWADGNTGYGLNYLGKLLIVVRYEIRNNIKLSLPPKSFMEAPMDKFLMY